MAAALGSLTDSLALVAAFGPAVLSERASGVSTAVLASHAHRAQHQAQAQAQTPAPRSRAAQIPALPTHPEDNNPALAALLLASAAWRRRLRGVDQSERGRDGGGGGDGSGGFGVARSLVGGLGGGLGFGGLGGGRGAVVAGPGDWCRMAEVLVAIRKPEQVPPSPLYPSTYPHPPPLLLYSITPLPSPLSSNPTPTPTPPFLPRSTQLKR